MEMEMVDEDENGDGDGDGNGDGNERKPTCPSACATMIRPVEIVVGIHAKLKEMHQTISKNMFGLYHPQPLQSAIHR